MTKRKIAAFFALTLILLQPIKAAKGFAIIIDQKSLNEAKNEIEAYAKAIKDVNKMKVYTIVDRWGVPDSIRACLRSMYYQGKIQGAVFIGDIPIPMIRDAQHLTSAFKMDQRLPKEKSSVPSDRFYDDFGLQFRFLEKDSTSTLYYYSLKSRSDQYVHSNLFTGRIRPTDVGGTSRYDKLRKYLRKVVEEKNAHNRLDRIFFLTGSGSIDESRVAVMDEKIQYYEHFPWLKNCTREAVKYVDYAQEKYIKFTLMDELQREDLDLSVLHHHGDFDTQYLNKEHKDVPKDYDEKMRDLHLSDFAEYKYNPSSRVVIFDACFNGAFQNEDCIANEYIFSNGKTIACMGGSVNVIQDKWYDRMLGLLAFGHTIGEVNNYQELLESHIIGDPTFCFAPETDIKESETADGQVWKLTQDFWNKKISSSKLLELLKTSPYDQVRMQALQFLARMNNADFVKGIAIAAEDRYEMVQRFAMNYIKTNGSDELAKPLLQTWTNPSTSARVKTDARMAVEFFKKDVLQRTYNEIWPKKNYVDKDSLGTKFYGIISKYGNYWEKEVDEIIADTLKDSAFRFSATCMRLYCPHSRIPDILKYIKDSKNDARRIPLIEAMGWYKYSYQAPIIAKAAKQLSEDSQQSEAVREEALKTYNRIMWNKR